MKKPFFIVVICGISAIVGIILYIVSKKDRTEKREENGNIVNKTESDITTSSYFDLLEQKADVASTISERHSVAEMIIRETLNEEKYDIDQSEHKVDFDEIDSSLDSLLDKE